MERTIQIDGGEVLLRCTGKTPLIYNALINRDLFADFEKFQKEAKKGKALSASALVTFLNIAYVMAWQAEDTYHRERIPNFPKTAGDWLDQFEMFSVYDHLDTVMEMMLADKKQLVYEKNL